MRNLKRVLSLALASIMLLGMMVVGASAADKKTAADLTDIDKVTNKDAVNLMVDLGIIVGKPDGSYAPTEGVDRATMAKLITYIMMGDVEQTAFQGTSTDLKDINTSWAEGYIKYCYSNGIITGDGKGNFFPTNGVTVVEASKMLLVALGYDAKAQGYTGNANWSTNIMKDAQKAGLIEDLGLKASDTLTRDAAAKMIFNALFANTVSNTYGYDLNGNKYVSGSVANKTTLGEETYNLQAVKGIVTGISANGKAIVDGVATELTAAPDQVGANVVYYKNSSTGKLISSTLSNGKTTILGTSTDGSSLKDLKNVDKAVYIASPDATVTYYVNGAKSNAIADDAAIAVGAIVDLIDNDNNGKYDVVRITEKTVATVGDNGVTISKATSASKEDAVTIDGIDAIKGVAISRVKGYTDLVKGDVVLYVKIGNTFYLETAESVTGVISGSKKVNSTTTGYILGGTTYVASGLKAGSDVVTPFKDFASYNKDLTLYLDNNGSVVKLVLDTEAESKDYAIVIDNAWRDQGFDDGFGQAKIVLTDGTTEIVTVSKVNNVKAEKDSNKIKNVTNGNFYAYVIDSNGDYALQTISKSTNTAFANNTVITRGVAKFAGSNNDFVGNNATTFIVKSGDKYNVYTGIANVPASKTSTSYVTGTALVNSNKVATFVYMDGANTQEATAQSTVYFLDVASFSYMPESSSGKGDDYYSYDAIVDGKLETVKVTPSFHAATGAGALANGLKAVIYDKSTGYITGYDNGGTVSNAVTGITSNEKAADGTILLGDTYYTYTDDTAVYLVNKETREASISSMDKVAKNAANAVITAVVKNAAATDAKKTTLTALYVEYKPSEGGSSDVTPGIASLTKVELSKDGGLKVTATVSEKAADKMDGTYKIEKYMENTNVWMEVDAGAISVVKEDTIGTATFAEAGDGLYRATVTLSGVTMTSGNFTYVK